MAYDELKVNIYSKHCMLSTGTTQLRCINPKEYLRELKVDVTLKTIYRSVPDARSINVLHRVALDDYTRLFIDYISLTGGVLAYDVDDLIFTEEGWGYLNQIGKRGSKGVDVFYLSAMKRCHFIIASTPYLVDEAERLVPKAKVRLIRNALNGNLFNQAEQIIEARNNSNNKYITLAYLSGSKSHDKDFHVIESQLLRLLSHNDKCKLLICGDLNYSKDFLAYGEQFEYRPRVPYQEYASIFREVDINLVPLDITEPFNHAKSELKYIEAGLFSIPSVMSPTRTYKEVIQSGVNGILAEDDHWYARLHSLLHDSSMREKLGNTARQHVVEGYSPSRRVRDWATLIEEIYNTHNSNPYGSLNSRIQLRAQLQFLRAYRMAKMFGGKLKQAILK